MPGPISALQGGKARAIAVTGQKRLGDLPGISLSQVPTFEEQGIKGVDVVFWFGILAPAGTPKPIVERLNADLAASINDSEVKAKFLQQSIEAAPGTAEAFTAFIAQQAAHWREVVKMTGTKQQ